MKRTLGVVVAIVGVLAFGSAATAAPVTFDLSGVVGWWARSGDNNAAIPGAPMNGGVCTPGMYSPPAPTGAGNDCFRYAFSAGSSVSIDITGSAVTMLGGTLIVDAVTPLVFNTIVLTMHHESSIEPGLIGTLTGDYIDWVSTENAWGSFAPMTTTGTISCSGVNCDLISMPEGTPFPFLSTYSVLSNTFSVQAIVLGQWLLDPQHDSILGSSLAVSAWSNVEYLGNRRQAAFTFGPTGLGIPAPEPVLPAVLLVAFSALFVRGFGSR